MEITKKDLLTEANKVFIKYLNQCLLVRDLKNGWIVPKQLSGNKSAVRQYYNIACTLNGQREDYDAQIALTADERGINGKRLVDFLHLGYDSLERQKREFEGENSTEETNSPDNYIEWLIRIGIKGQAAGFVAGQSGIEGQGILPFGYEKKSQERLDKVFKAS